MSGNIYEFINVMVFFCLIGVIIFIGLFFMGVWILKFVRKKDKEYKKQYDDLTDSVRETQTLFKNEVSELLGNIKNIFKDEGNEIRP